MTGGDMGMGFMWVLGPLLMIGLVVLVVVAVRALSGGTPDRPELDHGTSRSLDRSRAREILDERYARGEVTDDEYQEKLQGLRDSDSW